MISANWIKQPKVLPTTPQAKQKKILKQLEHNKQVVNIVISAYVTVAKDRMSMYPSFDPSYVAQVS